VGLLISRSWAGLRRRSIPNTVPKPDVGRPTVHPGGVRDTLPPALRGIAVGDLITEIRRDIDRRLDELRPVRDEFHRLEQAGNVLATATNAPRPARAEKASAGSSRSRMTRAQNQEVDRRVLALLQEDSAQRAAALAMMTETSVGSMNARLNRLVREASSRSASGEIPSATAPWAGSGHLPPAWLTRTSIRAKRSTTRRTSSPTAGPSVMSGRDCQHVGSFRFQLRRRVAYVLRVACGDDDGAARLGEDCGDAEA